LFLVFFFFFFFFFVVGNFLFGQVEATLKT